MHMCEGGKQVLHRMAVSLLMKHTHACTYSITNTYRHARTHTTQVLRTARSLLMEQLHAHRNEYHTAIVASISRTTNRRGERSLSLAESESAATCCSWDGDSSSVYNNDTMFSNSRRGERSISLAESVETFLYDEDHHNGGNSGGILTSGRRNLAESESVDVPMYDDEQNNGVHRTGSSSRRRDRCVSIGGSEYFDTAPSASDDCSSSTQNLGTECADVVMDRDAGRPRMMMESSGKKPCAGSNDPRRGGLEDDAQTGASMDMFMANMNMHGDGASKTDQMAKTECDCDHSGRRDGRMQAVDCTHANIAYGNQASNAVRRKVRDSDGDQHSMQVCVDEESIFGGAEGIYWRTPCKAQKTANGRVHANANGNCSNTGCEYQDAMHIPDYNDAFCMGITHVRDGYALLGAPLTKGADRFKLIFGSDPIVP
jgi:hypothetical protein